MDTECKNNRACHNKLSQENTNGNSLAVGCFKRWPWIMLLRSSTPLQSARSIWEASDSRLLRTPLLVHADTVNWRSFQSSVKDSFINGKSGDNKRCA